MSRGLFALVTDSCGNQGVISCDGKTIIPAEYKSIEYEYVYGNDNSRYAVVLFKFFKSDGSTEL